MSYCGSFHLPNWKGDCGEWITRGLVRIEKRYPAHRWRFCVIIFLIEGLWIIWTLDIACVLIYFTILVPDQTFGYVVYTFMGVRDGFRILAGTPDPRKGRNHETFPNLLPLFRSIS